MKRIIVYAVTFLQRFFPNLVNSKIKISLLKQQGVSVGEGTCIFDAGSVRIDSSRPALLEIGEYCKITGGTIILTHDYSRSVLRRVYGDVVGEARKTTIGNNVFIGMNSIILMGTHIGDNCIIGAGSICHGGYPGNSVIAGNPAKVICSLDEYYEKRKSKYVQEAVDYANFYKNKNGEYPSVKDMGAFFPLYLERSREALEINGIRTVLSGDDQEDIIKQFLNSTPEYKSYDEFIEKAREYE